MMKRMNKHVRGILQSSVRKNRRETIYKMIKRKHNGLVPCFCCGKHVKTNSATLEHIIPISKGGTDDMSNLSISHNVCNQRRGAEISDGYTNAL